MAHPKIPKEITLRSYANGCSDLFIDGMLLPFAIEEDSITIQPGAIDRVSLTFFADRVRIVDAD